ncbi:hypothetical protein SAMN05518861_116129 [Mesorhizobium sp. YR577]|nr:hypothetical protein SAMN05518861_116129 [Mesorhizobium sp. YR577]
MALCFWSYDEGSKPGVAGRPAHAFTLRILVVGHRSDDPARTFYHRNRGIIRCRGEIAGIGDLGLEDMWRQRCPKRFEGCGNDRAGFLEFVESG